MQFYNLTNDASNSIDISMEGWLPMTLMGQGTWIGEFCICGLELFSGTLGTNLIFLTLFD